MKVFGFSFIRNAVTFDYPIIEAITSILPLCDEFVIAVGKSEDETLELIRSIGSPKVRVLESVWNDSLREGGRVLAEETNKALREISPDSDWAFYIQGDEVVHEQYHAAIREGMEKWKNDSRVEGLLFNYRHFYGSYDYVADSRRWYRKEVRIVRPDPDIYSFRDAQGFQKKGRPLRVKPLDAWIHHYGWVKSPAKQQEKRKSFNKYWHSDAWMDKNIPDIHEFDYSGIDSLSHFTGTHPAVIQPRIDAMNWKFDADPTLKNFSFKGRCLHAIEKLTGWRVGEYKNHRII